MFNGNIYYYQSINCCYYYLRVIGEKKNYEIKLISMYELL